MDLAITAFRSTWPSLLWPVVEPDEQVDSVVLAREANDISGGDGLNADTAVFERFEPDDQPFQGTIVFWQREAKSGRRMVVVDAPQSWRGDWYYLFLVDEELSRVRFLQDYLSAKRVDFQQPDAATHILTPVPSGSRYSPPVILKDALTEELWVIDTGAPHASLPPWHIYVSVEGGMISPCQVDFVSHGVGLDRLPPAVRRFAELADGALGPGRNEGTLRPTARIRNSVARGWATVSERPWALTAPVYNTREEVENGLKLWAKGVPTRELLYSKLTEAYDTAQKALEIFYISSFGVEERLAHRYSTFAMDHMLRRHFVFHSESGGTLDMSKTPWPNDIR